MYPGGKMMLFVSIHVTGSVKRDLNSLFKMRILQGSIFPQHFVQSKSNPGVYGGGVVAAMRRK